MPQSSPDTGADIAARRFREQRLAEFPAPERIAAHFAAARDLAAEMDEADSELCSLALVVWHCARAICTALDART